MLKFLKNRLFNLITRAVTSFSRQEEGKLFYQIKGLSGEVRSDVEHICQFGFRSRPESGARGLLFALAGNKENSSLVVVDDKRYGKEVALEEGDTLVYNKEGTFSHYSGEELRHSAVSQQTLEVGDTSIVLDGSEITLNAGGATLILSSAGLILTGGDIVADSISLKTHVHGGVLIGGEVTGAPL